MAKLVVLDDDDSLRKAMVLALEREGHEVQDFEDASPALDEVDFDEVDLVVSDLVMPTPGDQFIIPFAQLRFKPADKLIWGFNVTRRHIANNEWSQFVVDRSANFFARRWTREIGELHGLRAIVTGRPLTVKPYILPGLSRDFDATNSKDHRNFEAGGDIRYGITANLALDFSFNTDFAQVEGDQETVNLTQFKTFLPERREFFLEGSPLFQFGEEAENQGSRPPTALFYSRQIGMESGVQTPILVGAKLAGKVGKTGIGALNVLTEEASLLSDGDTLRVFEKNYSVARVRRDVMQKSAVGMMLVNKQSADGKGGWAAYNRSAGVDFTWGRSRSNLTLTGFFARTWDSVENIVGDAGYLDLRYSGKKLNYRAKFLQLDSGFSPSVGFVNRRGDLAGLRRYNVDSWTRFTLGWGDLYTGPAMQAFTDLNDDLKFLSVRWRGFWKLRSGDWSQVPRGLY